jgi:hypothetical protein
MEHENYCPNFDEIVLHIMPLLKNGVMPEQQTILSVLESIAEHVDEGCRRFAESGQQTLFGDF